MGPGSYLGVRAGEKDKGKGDRQVEGRIDIHQTCKYR